VLVKARYEGRRAWMLFDGLGNTISRLAEME